MVILKNKVFYLTLLIIYILLLSKDSILGLVKEKKPDLSNIKEAYYEKEYQDLAKMLDISYENYEIKYGKVILRNIYDFYNKIDINLGSDKIKVGDIVLNEDGLIGVVSKTYKNYSTVELLTNNEINISVKINDSYGILESANNKIKIEDVKLNEQINAGDKIYTSGLTSIKPNILIGTVKNVLKGSLELEYEIEVEPSVNFYNINYIGVIAS